MTVMATRNSGAVLAFAAVATCLSAQESPSPGDLCGAVIDENGSGIKEALAFS